MKFKKRVLAILIAAAMVAAFTIHAAAYNTGAGDLAMMVEVDAGEAGKVPIYDWLIANNGAYALDEITFELYKSDEGGSMIGAVISTSTIGTDSMVTFKNVPVGWYLVREVLNDASVLFLDADDQLIHFYFDGTETYDSQYFDFDAFYTIVNGYGYGYTLGYPGLNNTGDIFRIAVTNTTTGVAYPSFCAHAGSKNFAGQSGLGCNGYLVAEPGYLNFIEGNAKHSDFLKAYNYICDTYGDLNDYRAVTQIITWALLGSIVISSEDFDNITWDAVENGNDSIAGVSDAKAIVEDVMANYKKHSGSGAIVDVIYLYCEHHHDASDCQPQLVPIYSVAGNDLVVKVGGFVNTPVPQQPDEPQTSDPDPDPNPEPDPDPDPEPDPDPDPDPDPNPNPNPNPDPDPDPTRTRTRTTNADSEEFVYFEEEIPLVNLVWTENVEVAENTEPMEFEDVEFIDDSLPLSQMPQTGVEDSMTLWILALCLSLLAAGITTTSIVITKKSNRNAI